MQVQGLTVQVIITGQLNGDDGASQKVMVDKKVSFTNGTGNNQLTGWLNDESRRINATNEDIDLNGGSNKDAFGNALAFGNLKVIFAENLDQDTGDTLAISQPASNGVPNVFKASGDGIKVHPNGFLLWVAPGPDSPVVTGSTGDLINFAMADDSTLNLFLAG